MSEALEHTEQRECESWVHRYPNTNEAEDDVMSAISGGIKGKIPKKVDLQGFIKTCVADAIANARRHGGHRKENGKTVFSNDGRRKEPDPEAFFYVAFFANNESICIEVGDDGDGFNWKDLPDPTTSENVRKTSGRGLFMIRRIADFVYWNEKGNRICMVWYLNGSPSKQMVTPEEKKWLLDGIQPAKGEISIPAPGDARVSLSSLLNTFFASRSQQKSQ